MASILYLTDFYYKADSRNYYEEDLYLTGRLKDHFDVLIGHPQQALSFLHSADLVVFRNTGPVMWYKEYFQRFVAAVNETGIATFNSFDGKADMKGKAYLPQLFREGYPVIPTVEKMEDLHLLGTPERYMVKLKDGADSHGLQRVAHADLLQAPPADRLIQPFVDFDYEVSFYYLDNTFQYALYAPDKQQRWALQPYRPTAGDLAFADRFVAWNNMTRGISRVDACRQKDGSLLLVELEDLNPYLSLAVLSDEKRQVFTGHFIDALKKAVDHRQR